MEAIKYRILSLGDLPNSMGGIYNGGCAAFHESKRILLPRVEKNYMFTNDVDAVLIEGDVEDLKKGQYTSKVLTKVGFSPDSRIEDFRLFIHNDQLYACHTLVLGWNGSSMSTPKLITPVISKIVDDKIILFDYLSLPIKRQPTEKNWQIFSWNGDLYCLYSLDPLIIFKHIGFSWHPIKEEENGLIELVHGRLPGSGYLSLSAMTHWRDEFMLGFWHTYVHGVIHQGAFILNMKTLDITEFTQPVLTGEGWDDGYKKGIVYVSGLVVTESTVEAWVGECDSHTSLVEIPKEALTQVLVQSPFKKLTPLKVFFNDAGLGDYICAMYAIQGWLDANPDNSVILYLRQHFELASVLKMPRVKIVQYSDQKYVVDLTSNEKEEEYKEKLKHSYKKWYGWKLGGISPAVPQIREIQEIGIYKDCVVLFPFSAWDLRTWGLEYWILLSEILMQKGYHVVVVDHYENRIDKVHGEHFIHKSLMETFKLVKSAKLVISNESFGAHLAGLLGTDCICLSGWLNPEVVNDMTKNNFIWKQETNNPGRNLQLITCDDVLAKMDEMGIEP